MIIVHINSVPNFSTGKISLAISRLANSNEGCESYFLYSYGKTDELHTIKFANALETFLNKFCSHLFGSYGFYGKKTTRRLIKHLKAIKPDIVHLHNVHSHDLNFEFLCKELKKLDLKVVYTFHDCWAFTGYCPYFDYSCCDKWESGCDHCPLRRNFSLFFDKSKKNYERKKQCLLPLPLTIVSPSNWLDNLVSKSFLQSKTHIVINNGINLNIFKPTYSDSILSKYDLLNKKYILGVAAFWEKRKGLPDLLKLSNMLPNDVTLVVVGYVDKNLNKKLYPNITFINSTNDQTELACIYSNCVCLVNPTLEENFPTVNLECIACGKPVVTYDSGGCSETINQYCGILVKKNDFNMLFDSVLEIATGKRLFKEVDCLSFSKEFDQNICFEKYIDLYYQLMELKKE